MTNPTSTRHTTLGRNSYLADGVQRAIDRPPRDFADYARDTAATGVWNLEAQVS
jgi:hypothetical protein